MSKFKFMEIAINLPSNRNTFKTTTEVINIPFQKENRFKEFWRGLYSFETTNPTEKDAMFGNFYFESDIIDFATNQSLILEAIKYLNKEYKIPYEYFDLYLTNKSIWVTIPTKVFGCYGSKKLNLIHKKMAEEINENIFLNQEYTRGLDLSIYKWNGLTHSIGSYLHKSKRWVTKFTYYDLNQASRIEDVLIAKYDNCFGFEDIKEVDSAKKWFLKLKNEVIKPKFKTNTCSNCTNRACMNKLKEIGYISENRNLHIYSYALHLKEKNYTTKEAILEIKKTFSNEYVNSKEAIRTIKSAIEGKKSFNCRTVKEYLDDTLFECSTCDSNKTSQKSHLIIPRKFIELLNKEKANYKVYELLIDILIKNQFDKEDFCLSLEGDKYKQDTISLFNILKKLEIINFEIVENNILTKLIYKNKSEIKSHIKIKRNLIKTLTKTQKSIKIILELLRGSIFTEESYFFNFKVKNIAKNLFISEKTVKTHLSILKNMGIIVNNTIVLKETIDNIKELVKNRNNYSRNNNLNNNETYIQFIETIDNLFKEYLSNPNKSDSITT